MARNRQGTFIRDTRPHSEKEAIMREIFSNKFKGGRKRNGPGTAKNYNDRPGANCNGTVSAFLKQGRDEYGRKK